MRITLTIEDHLHQELKKLASSTRRTFNAVVEDALRESLLRRQHTKRVDLPTSTGFGLQPFVDLDDFSSLLDRMGGRG